MKSEMVGKGQKKEKTGVRVVRELCKAAREANGAGIDLWSSQGQNSVAKSENSVKEEKKFNLSETKCIRESQR